MDPARQLRVIWGYRWWLLLAALAAAAAAYFVSDSLKPSYRAEALAQVIPSEQAEGSFLGEDELLSFTNLYAELAKSTSVIEAARGKGFRDVPYATFREDVKVAPEQELGVLTLTGEAENGATAARYANAYSEAFSEYVDSTQAEQRDTRIARIDSRLEDLQGRLEDASSDSETATIQAELEALQARAAEERLRSGDSVRVFQRATAPTSPESPKPVRNAILAFLAMLVIGAALAYLRFTVTNRYGSSDEAAQDLELPLLAEIPAAREDEVPSVESFRMLRASVDFALGERRRTNEALSSLAPAGANGAGDPAAARRLARTSADPNGAGLGEESGVLLITSPESGSGKSHVVTNLSRAFAFDGRLVVAMDGDLRRPTLHERLGVALEPGLRDLLSSNTPTRADVAMLLTKRVPLAEAALRRGGELKVLTAGQPLEDSAETLSTNRMGEAVDALAEQHDLVVLDSPPVLAIVDAVVLTRYSDGVVLVIDGRKTRRRDARRAVQTLRAMQAPILGFVFNGAPSPRSYSSYYSAQPQPQQIAPQAPSRS